MNQVFIIAEAGVNHNGSLSLAKKLVDVAKEAGANAVKFQTFITKELVTKKAQKASYQITKEQTQYQMIKKLELSFDEFKKLKDYCNKKDIMFLSTPFDIKSAIFLNDLGVEIFKIPSGEITNYFLIKTIAQFQKKVILSTGMSDMLDIQNAIDLLLKYGTKKQDITILHCNSQYPTPFEDVNLKAMLSIKEKFGTEVGYSDHTLGIEVPVAAVSLGAKVIEKHFTLSNKLVGPDHRASLSPNELKNMVKAIRNIEVALGDGIKKVTKSEIVNKIVARKVLVAKKDIYKGEIFNEDNLIAKRVGKDGISPMRFEDIKGQIAKKNYKIDEVIDEF